VQIYHRFHNANGLCDAKRTVNRYFSSHRALLLPLDQDSFLAREYTSRAYATMSVSSVCPSVHLSVTEVHWRIIANLDFKFRSHFTVHCSRSAAYGRRAAHCAACGRIISRHASQC